jgi:thymidylate synthase ThyX
MARSRSEPDSTPDRDSEIPAEAAGTVVFCVQGADPEVQAYAMAKYSRSALSMKESLAELDEQQAEKFLNTFYFQYGHRSIADLAHITTAIERLSLLAAIAVVDEQRWDGQERSTRYQDFKQSGYFTPDFTAAGESPALSGNADAEASASARNAESYRETAAFLFSEYEQISKDMFRYLADGTPRPAEMKPEAYKRALQARAFDLARYLLPLATNTSLGQIVNARTLETQIARLLAHTHAEVRSLGAQLKAAARRGAYNVKHKTWRELAEAIRAKDEVLGALAAKQLLREVPVAPTLVKYAEASQYQMETRHELRQAASELMRGAEIPRAEAVTLLEPESIETELASTLLYEYCHYPYAQIRQRVDSLSSAERDEIISLGACHRGQHDELLRAFCAGQSFRFDILMDIGAYRDLHRHRRCTQIAQEFTTAHGFEMPEEITAADLAGRYTSAMDRAESAAYTLHNALSRQIESAEEPKPRREGELAPEAQYLIPLAFRKRALFKMDLAEVVYIAELRTSPAGHWSYRNVAWQMYQAVAKQHPSLARYFRVHDVRQPVDLLNR